MIYHTTLAATVAGTFTILPRTTDITISDNIRITNQETNKNQTVTFLVAFYDSNDELVIIFSLPDSSLDEGVFYEIEITKNVTDAVLWRGVLFCSSQTKADYSINNGEFTEQTSTNEFIIL